MILDYALRGVRRHGGVFALLAAAVAAAVALGALLLAAVGAVTSAFVARVPPLQLPAPAVAFYRAGGAGDPAQRLPTGLGLRLVVAGFPGSPARGTVAAPAWLVRAAGLHTGDPLAVGTHTLRLGPAYATPWDRALPLLIVAPGSLPLTGKLYAGSDPPAGATWVLGPGTGAAQARADLAAVYSPVDLVIAGVALLGGLGVADSFLLGLLRRRRQLGIARAVGWESGQVASWLLTEAALVMLVGAAAGWIVAEAVASAAALPRPGVVDVAIALLAVAAGPALAVRRPGAWLRARTVADLLR